VTSPTDHRRAAAIVRIVINRLSFLALKIAGIQMKIM